MIKTSHDLCANTAKLNLNELIETAKIAVAYSRHNCERKLQEIQEAQNVVADKWPDKWRASYAIANAAHDLVMAATDLSKATNSLHYLLNAQDREEIKVDKGE